jgi:hypothetical protein
MGFTPDGMLVQGWHLIEPLKFPQKLWHVFRRRKVTVSKPHLPHFLPLTDHKNTTFCHHFCQNSQQKRKNTTPKKHAKNTP